MAASPAVGETGGMTPPPYPHYRHRFSAEIISYAVWLYHVFSLSLRDVELLLAERGTLVSYETVRRWGKKFGASSSLLLRDQGLALRVIAEKITASGVSISHAGVKNALTAANRQQVPS